MRYNPLDCKLYKARTKLTKNIFSLEQAPQETPTQTEPVQEKSVGYLSVSAFTASGALPVPDALITIYTLDENGQEHEILHYITDVNGQVPLITLPVVYDPFSPFESTAFYFSTYNLRAQAINYYTINILDLRIFPETTTIINLDMIPAPVGPTDGREMTIIIPPSPPDISND